MEVGATNAERAMHRFADELHSISARVDKLTTAMQNNIEAGKAQVEQVGKEINAQEAA